MTGLARCRKAAKLSQIELAKILGVSQSAVAAWENGAAFPNASKLPTLAKVLECTIDDLFSPEEQESMMNTAAFAKG